MTAGFLLVDKPGGPTSHDVVATVRRLTGGRKVGHAGTLDPMATGLLVLGLGRATRLLRFVQGAPKTYVARMVLGVATDTLDADGAVMERRPLPVSEDEVAAAAGRFVGSILQIPPMVSARKVEGRRLYELAREGKTVEREARRVEIEGIEILDFSPCDYPEVLFRVRCSSGTYVRSLADDIGRALGGRAHLSSLRRHRIGSLSVDEAWSPAELEDLAVQARFEDALVPPGRGLADLPSVTVDDDVGRGVGHGVAFPAAVLGGHEGPFRVLDGAGALLAVYRGEEGRARPEVVVG
jgi:tRNA pseudouridine55 synthase